jgi:hypothetical protein
VRPFHFESGRSATADEVFNEPPDGAAGKLLTRDEARRIAANIAKDAGPRHSLVIVSGPSR